MNSRDFLLAGIAFLLALTAFAGTLKYELVWDDRGVLEHIGSITDKGGVREVLLPSSLFIVWRRVTYRVIAGLY